MAIKHTEFMKLAQGDRSVTEYWHDFIHLSRYAPDLVNTDAKRIASFKRGLCPKLMKTMCTSKCATFNEFVSDTLLQENCNDVYAASKCHKIASEARASQSSTFVTVTSILNHLTYLPDIGHIRKGVRSRRAMLRKESLTSRQVTDRVGTAICQVIGPKILLILKRI
jgi:hypothetical protein